jgi:ribonuclease/clavin/mitogillin
MMKQFTEPEDHYLEISPEGNLAIPFSTSRQFLAEAGIAGEILPTSGHSSDSVSLLLDNGAAFTGDLTPPGLAWGETARQVKARWQLLKDHGASCIYPGHGDIWQLDRI